jgi:hypothetical protein
LEKWRKQQRKKGLKRLFHLSSIFEKSDRSLVRHRVWIFLIGKLFAGPAHGAGISFCFISFPFPEIGVEFIIYI